MNVDPAMNMVVFEVRTGAGLEKLAGRGPTIADDCVKGLWRAVRASRGAGLEVLRVYSEWEPSASDQAFIRSEFPDAALTYSFSRPSSEDGWPSALEAARQEILAASHRQTAVQAPRRRWWQLWR